MSEVFVSVSVCSHLLISKYRRGWLGCHWFWRHCTKDTVNENIHRILRRLWMFSVQNVTAILRNIYQDFSLGTQKNKTLNWNKKQMQGTITVIGDCFNVLVRVSVVFKIHPEKWESFQLLIKMAFGWAERARERRITHHMSYPEYIWCAVCTFACSCDITAASQNWCMCMKSRKKTFIRYLSVNLPVTVTEPCLPSAFQREQCGCDCVTWWTGNFRCDTVTELKAAGLLSSVELVWRVPEDGAATGPGFVSASGVVLHRTSLARSGLLPWETMSRIQAGQESRGRCHGSFRTHWSAFSH